MNIKPLITAFLMLPLVAVAKDVITEGPTGGVNWTQGYVWAEGYGVARDDAADRKKRLLARRAAQVDAYRNLGEYLNGVRVSSETVVQEMVLASDVVRTKVETLIKGAMVTKDTYQNEVAQVTMRVYFEGDFSSAINTAISGGGRTVSERYYWDPMHKLQSVVEYLVDTAITSAHAQEAGALIRNSADLELAKRLLERTAENEANAVLEQLKADAEAYQSASRFTGLLVDASDVGAFQLATIPRIRNAEGEIIYPNDELLGGGLAAKRPVSYDFDVDDAIENERVKYTPYVIKAESIYRSRNSDLVISDTDAQFIIGNTPLLGAISDAGVMIVVAE